MKGLLIFLFIIGVVMLILGRVGQEPVLVSPFNAPGPNRTATLIPAFVATAQSAEAASQATQSAGRGQMAQMDVTATALSIEREVVSLQMTQAAATEEYFQRQTVEAFSATQAAETALAATAHTQATETRQAFFDGGTATAEAIIQAGRATATQAAMMVIQAAADAEVQRIRDEQATQNLRTWLWRGFWTVIAVSSFTIFFWTLIQFRRAILARMLLVRYGPKGRGKPYIPVLQTDGSEKYVDMSKSAGPIIDVPASGAGLVQGMLDDPQMQTYIAVQAALADMLMALNTTNGEHRLPWEKDNAQTHSPERKKANSAISAALLQRAAQQQAAFQAQLTSQQAGMRYLPTEIIHSQFREAAPEDRNVGGWLNDVQSKLLD